MIGESAFPAEPLPELLPRPETLPQPDPEPLLTLRVSHDSGRTWEPRRAVRGSDPFASAEWPPCECPEHREH